MRKQRKKVFAKSYVIIFMMFLTVSIFSISTTYVMGTHIVLTPEEEQKVTTEIALLATNEGIIFENYQYILQDVHLANEQKIGYVIEFDFQGQYGYSIIFKLGDEIKIVEVFFGRRSPFFEKMGTYIYPSLGTYIIKFNGQYYDLTNDEAYSHLEIKNANGFNTTRSIINGSTTNQTIKIPYKSGFRMQYEIPNFYYNYSTELTSDSNNCANVAGLILINYWNKKLNNDLLNLNSMEVNSNTGNILLIKGAQIMNTFYDYMSTNWFLGLAGGTLPSDFYDGFRKLVRENGYEVNGKGDSLTSFPDYTQIKKYLREGIPIAITSTDYFFADLSNLGTVETIDGKYSLDIEYERSKGIGTSHTFIAYGYDYYTLYRDVEVSVWSPVWYNPFRYVTEIREEKTREELLKVATGWGDTRFFNYTRSNLYDVVAMEVHK